MPGAPGRATAGDREASAFDPADDLAKLPITPHARRLISECLTLSFPAGIVPLIREHLRAHVAEDATALVFAGPNGGVLRRGNFRRVSRWALAVETLGLPNLHFYDLRHTGNTLRRRAGRACGTSWTHGA